MNLGVPTMARLLRKLKNKGFNVDDTVFDVESAKNEIIRALRND